MITQARFWNDPSNIRWFANEPAPDYWRDFFTEHKTTYSQKVLDLGCGAGRNTELLYRLGYDVYACDLHLGMIRATKERLVKAGMEEKEVKYRIVQATMLRLPYGLDTFDIVLSNGVYHNVDSTDEMIQAVGESARILKDQGLVCFNLFSSDYIDQTLKKITANTYLTKEGLPMVLISPRDFLSICRSNSLVLEGELKSYNREVSTGVRSVMRGVSRKK